MIIQCESWSRKFIVKDIDIPEEGRTVQCGYCSVTWHQKPITITKKDISEICKISEVTINKCTKKLELNNDLFK